VVHELREDSLAEIHPSLSEIMSGFGGRANSGAFQPEKLQIEKTGFAGSLMIPLGLCRRRKF
jgi:hypothetical protein